MGLQGPVLSPFLQVLTGVARAPSLFYTWGNRGSRKKGFSFFFFSKLLLLGLSPWKKINIWAQIMLWKGMSLGTKFGGGGQVGKSQSTYGAGPMGRGLGTKWVGLKSANGAGPGNQAPEIVPSLSA